MSHLGYEVSFAETIGRLRQIVPHHPQPLCSFDNLLLFDLLSVLSAGLLLLATYLVNSVASFATTR